MDFKNQYSSTPILQHSVSLSFDRLDRDHVRGSRLLERQPGSDGDQVTAFDEPQLQRFLLGVSQHRVRTLKSRDLNRVDAPYEAKSLQG
jgi:hypothetical protein